jgi:hypothetical protein
MNCYECSQGGIATEAVGSCHHCSVGLCGEHANMVADPVTVMYPVAKTLVLPRKARVLLCEVCKAALEQSTVAGSQSS